MLAVSKQSRRNLVHDLIYLRNEFRTDNLALDSNGIFLTRDDVIGAGVGTEGYDLGVDTGCDKALLDVGTVLFTAVDQYNRHTPVTSLR